MPAVAVIVAICGSVEVLSDKEAEVVVELETSEIAVEEVLIVVVVVEDTDDGMTATNDHN